MKTYDLIIVGGGVAGMLCAINSNKNGVENILLIEKDPMLGGSLNLLSFPLKNKRLNNSTDYKNSLIEDISSRNIDIQLSTLVININEKGNLICVSPTGGLEELSAKYIVLANGSKEKGLNTLEIAGDRCSGVFSLKTAKKIFNMNNVVPGKNIVIYGNENLSFIKNELDSKRANVVALVATNIHSHDSELANNIYEGYKVISIIGKDRISSVIISDGTNEKEIPCDCLIFSQGLLSDGLVSFRSGITLDPSTTGPKVDSSFETSMKNVFACGDGIYIHNSSEDLEEESTKLSAILFNKLQN